jgi:hypothetical protein
MTTIPDLSPWMALNGSRGVLTVGWLGNDAPFATGPVDEAVFAKLMALLVEPANPLKSMGYHAVRAMPVLAVLPRG